MSKMQDIREGLAAQIGELDGIRVSANYLDAPRPPVALVLPDRIEYDLNANRGADTLFFTVQVIVTRANERQAQVTLDKFTVGADSIKDAIEADRTLGGKADTCRVTELRNYGQITIGDVLYLGFELEVEVVA
jgi:hypothetical protein